MGLQHLPLEFARPIFAYLPLASLIALFATFDRKLQRLLSAPGALNILEIYHYDLAAPLMYFLSSIRNVDHLYLCDDLCWKPTRLPLLKTMNPRRITLGSGFMHPTVPKLLAEYELCTYSQQQLRPVRFLTAGGFPDFEQLAPRLERLTMRANSIWQQEFRSNSVLLLSHQGKLERANKFFDLSLPSTLTSLTLRAPNADFPTSILMHLPTHLRELTLLTTEPASQCKPPLALIIDRLPLLEKLHVRHFRHLSLHTPLKVPPTLHSISLPLSADLIERTGGITKSNILLMSLAELEAPLALRRLPTTRLMSASEICPPNLTFLKYCSETNPPVALTSLPTSLTSLVLHLNAPTLFMHSIYVMSALKVLVINTRVRYINLSDSMPDIEEPNTDFFAKLRQSVSVDVTLRLLPRSLDCLALCGALRTPMEPADVLHLPPSLRAFYIDSFTPEVLQSVKSHLPNCITGRLPSRFLKNGRASKFQ